MKIYRSKATRILAILSVICIILLAAGIILTVTGVSDIALQTLLIGFCGFLTILFFCCFIAEHSRVLIIKDNEIIFPRGAEKNGKTVFQKTVVKISEIASVESKFYKGDRIITGDCFFHTLSLTDGTSVTVTLYAYGKEAEKEILESLQKSIS